MNRLLRLLERHPGLAVIGAHKGLAVGGLDLQVLIDGNGCDVAGVGDLERFPVHAAVPGMNQSGAVSAGPDVTAFGNNYPELNIRTLRVGLMPLAEICGVDQLAVRSNAPVDSLLQGTPVSVVGLRLLVGGCRQ